MKNILLLFLLTHQLHAHASRKDTTVILYYLHNEISIDIRYPQVEKSKGTILLLHGYNLPADDWCTKTSFCQLANKHGFITVTPDFGKTTYHNSTYLETLYKYRPYPTRKWIVDSCLTALQEQLKLFLPGENNFIAGISTGARGAMLIAMDRPELFKAAASLSGDFNQSKLSNDAIYTGYYGLHSKFSARWDTIDNIQHDISKVVFPLYLAHGKLDKTCPVSQTVLFYNALKLAQPNLDVELVVDELGEHNYAFWEKQSKPMMEFFIKHLKE